MGIPTDVWRARIGCFVQPGARAINSFIYRSSRHVSTNRYRRAKHDSQGQGCDSVFTGTCTSSVVIKLLLVTLLLRAGVESNPGPGPTVPGDGAGSFTQCGVVAKFHSWNYRNLHGLTFVNGLKLEVPLLLV